MQRSAKPPKPRTASRQQAAYRDDLAYIHDAGFGGFAADAAPWLLSTACANEASATGWSSTWAAAAASGRGALTLAGYEVLGFDISRGDGRRWRSRRVPQANSASNRFSTAELPPCVAVTAIGEIFNYLFDRRQHAGAAARSCFAACIKALRPGGLLRVRRGRARARAGRPAPDLQRRARLGLPGRSRGRCRASRLSRAASPAFARSATLSPRPRSSPPAALRPRETDGGSCARSAFACGR